MLDSKNHAYTGNIPKAPGLRVKILVSNGVWYRGVPLYTGGVCMQNRLLYTCYNVNAGGPEALSKWIGVIKIIVL